MISVELYSDVDTDNLFVVLRKLGVGQRLPSWVRVSCDNRHVMVCSDNGHVKVGSDNGHVSVSCVSRHVGSAVLVDM